MSSAPLRPEEELERLSPSTQSLDDALDGIEYSLDRLADFLPGPLPGIAGQVSGAFGMGAALDADADPFERASGVINSLGSAIGGAAAIGQGISGGLGAGGAASAAAMTAAAPLMMASMIVGQFALMGQPYYKEANAAAERGKTEGFYLGLAAGVTNAGDDYVTNSLDVYRHTISASYIERAHHDAYGIALGAGYRLGQSFSSEHKKDFLQRMFQVIVDTKLPMAASSDDYTKVIFAVAAAAEKVAEGFVDDDADPSADDADVTPVPVALGDAGLVSRPDEAADAQPLPDDDAGLVSRPDEDADAQPLPDDDAGLVSRPDEDADAQPLPDDDAGTNVPAEGHEMEEGDAG